MRYFFPLNTCYHDLIIILILERVLEIIWSLTEQCVICRVTEKIHWSAGSPLFHGGANAQSGSRRPVYQNHISYSKDRQEKQPDYSNSKSTASKITIKLLPFLYVKSLSRVRLFATPWTAGSSIHGILQARVLEWVSFSRGSFWPRDRTRVSRNVGRCFTIWATREMALNTDKCNSLKWASESLSFVRLFATPWIILSMETSRPEY